MSILSESVAYKEMDARLYANGFDDIINNRYQLSYLSNLMEDFGLLDEAAVVDHLKLEIVDIDKFVKVNDCKPVTNPVAFVRSGIPTDDGLLSNTIFGITRDDRAGIFAYIDLDGYYIDPSCYKSWVTMDKRIKSVIHGTTKFIIDKHGDLVEDENGETGIDFLRNNIDKIKLKSTGSRTRDIKIQYIEKNKDKMFINKYPVIPPFYRDANTSSGRVSLGGINKLYQMLLQAVGSKKSAQDFGFDMTDSTNGRIQEILLNIYDWFVGNQNPSIQVETGSGMSGKKGIIKRANMSKTTNYSSRHVITAPEMKVETVDSAMVNMEYSAAPLAGIIADARPFIMFNVKRFFENEFLGSETYPVLNEKGKVEYVRLKDPLIEFSDERIKREMDRFLHGHNNRFIPIEVPIEDDKRKVYMAFKGRYESIDNAQNNPEPIYHRRLTWCDVFYMAAVESVRDKYALITRYPIDSYFNQISTKVRVSSTKKTEPMYVGNTYYPFYPSIKEEEIGKNTGNKFVDTMCISNLYLKGMGADYDGDTVSLRIAYTVEANKELEEYAHSKRNFIDLGCKNIRFVDGDLLQSMYSFTKVLSDTKLTDPVFT